jgi:hypothetical protein
VNHHTWLRKQKANGRRLIYMGDPRYNASPEFFNELKTKWTLTASHVPTRWFGLADVVNVYERL